MIGKSYVSRKVDVKCLKTNKTISYCSVTIASTETKTAISTITRAIKHRKGKTRKYIYSYTEATNAAIEKADVIYNESKLLFM